jgi:AcrR family transcriptional regulator
MTTCTVETVTETPEPKKRTRNPEEKRAAILAAARLEFAERGYEKATIRAIAKRAGVTHGLVLLHFANKERLFYDAAEGPQVLGEQVQGDLEGLPARVAQAFVRRMESADGGDPLIAVIRSAASHGQAATALLQTMREQSTLAFAQVLDGPGTQARVDMVGALLIGVTFNRYVAGGGPLAEMPPEELVEHMTRCLRAVLLD